MNGFPLSVARSSDSLRDLCTTNVLNLRRAWKFSGGELHKLFGSCILRCEDCCDREAAFVGKNVAVCVLNFLDQMMRSQQCQQLCHLARLTATEFRSCGTGLVTE